MVLPHSRLSMTIVAVIAISVLSGCKGTRVSDSLSLTDLQNKQNGVALMRASFSSRNCAAEYYTLAQKVGKQPYPYRKLNHVRTPIPLFYMAGPSVAQVELKAGKYYIVDYSCNIIDSNYTMRTTRSTTITLRPDRTKINDTYHYKRAITSFTVKPGEVVNVGYLYLGTVGGYIQGVTHSGRANFSVTDLPKKHYEWLKSNRPNLYRKMVKRTMVLVR